MLKTVVFIQISIGFYLFEDKVNQIVATWVIFFS